MKVSVKGAEENENGAIAKPEEKGEEKLSDVDHAPATAGRCLNIDESGPE